MQNSAMNGTHPVAILKSGNDYNGGLVNINENTPTLESDVDEQMLVYHIKGFFDEERNCYQEQQATITVYKAPDLQVYLNGNGINSDVANVVCVEQPFTIAMDVLNKSEGEDITYTVKVSSNDDLSGLSDEMLTEDGQVFTGGYLHFNQNLTLTGTHTSIITYTIEATNSFGCTFAKNVIVELTNNEDCQKPCFIVNEISYGDRYPSQFVELVVYDCNHTCSPLI